MKGPLGRFERTAQCTPPAPASLVLPFVVGHATIAATVTSAEPLCQGIDPGAVLAAIRARAERRRAGNFEPDGHKIGLVVEGGGLRGVCTAGGVVALEHLGFTDLFDDVYGTSAGAMNGAYFLAGQAAFGLRIYYEDMVSREVVNPWRFWRILDVERLFQRAVQGDKALDLEAVLAARSRLHITMIDAAAGARTQVETSALAGPTELLQALKAATAIPVLYNRRVDVGGRPCMDAGILSPVPIEEALADRCTAVLVLLSRPADFRRPAAGRVSRWFFNRLCARGSLPLARAYAGQYLLDARLRDLALGRSESPPPAVSLATICTDAAYTVERLTTDARRLQAAAVAFGRKTLRVFGAGDAETWLPASPPDQ
jgi:predicted patatin/cPLA2 family phospholipase